MRAFVTGATGFVGSHLVDALLQRGDDVTALVRDPAKGARLFGNRPRVVVGSLADEAALQAGCQAADVIFHLAALTAARSRNEFFAVNERATATLLRIAARAPGGPRRFIYVSSLAAAGPTVADRPLREDAPPAPVTDYGRSKLAGEERTRASDLPWTIVRPPAVYGPRDTEFLRVFRMAARGFGVVMGGGEQQVSLVYVGDLVDALLHAAAPATTGRTYFAAHPEVVTQRELVQRVGAAVSWGTERARPIRVLPVPGPAARVALTAIGAGARALGARTLLTGDKANEFLAEAFTCTSAALERDTGWCAAVPLTEGLRRTIAWYRDARWV